MMAAVGRLLKLVNNASHVASYSCTNSSQRMPPLDNYPREVRATSSQPLIFGNVHNNVCGYLPARRLTVRLVASRLASVQDDVRRFRSNE